MTPTTAATFRRTAEIHRASARHYRQRVRERPCMPSVEAIHCLDQAASWERSAREYDSLADTLELEPTDA